MRTTDCNASSSVHSNKLRRHHQLLRRHHVAVAIVDQQQQQQWMMRFLFLFAITATICTVGAATITTTSLRGSSSSSSSQEHHNETYADQRHPDSSLSASSDDTTQQQQLLWPRHRKLLLGLGGRSSTNEWIIMFKHDDNGDRDGILQRIGDGRIRYKFQKFIIAIVVNNLSNDTLNWLLERDEILYIEQEQPVRLMQQQQLSNVTQSLKDGQPWGIDVVDGLQDNKYAYTWTGKGVNVYIFDTGIQVTHNEFAVARNQQSRATCGINLVETEAVDPDEPCKDEKGHGTHVAGTIGGITYGIAKGASVIGVKVLDSNGDGTTTGVVKGLAYVMEQKAAKRTTPMIVNLSLGSGRSTVMNEAIVLAHTAGIIVVGAAGNESVDACTTSPASADKGITVGAITTTLRRPNWSNYGPCVDIHAPGEEILSAFSDPTDRKKTFVRSGTSMSAPHVAGVVALYLERNPALLPDAVSADVIKDAGINRILGLINSNNTLISTVAIRNRGALPPPTASPPTAPVSTPVVPPSPTSIRETPPPAPSSAPAVPLPQCGVILLSKCDKSIECCLQNCRNFGGRLGKRCFFF